METSYIFNNLFELIETAKVYRNGRKRQKLAEGSIKLPLNADFENIVSCLPALIKLNNLIGMEDVKKNIIDQILFYSQGLNTNEMMHTCLTGPPGVGKTTLGKILAEIYCSLGFLETDKFKVVSRSDLIAGYVGQTALKTLKVLKEAKGGVLFIDEAYSLGVGEDDKGSYGKECIDTINKFLSENTNDFIVIIAGYQDELDKFFFGINKGLRRRFPWNYDIIKYTPDNLKDIFIYQVENNKWSFEESIKLNNYKLLSDLFKEYSGIFNNNGGDTLILYDKAKICHSRRVFGKKQNLKKILNITDIRLAAELMKSGNKPKDDTVPYGMYL